MHQVKTARLRSARFRVTRRALLAAAVLSVVPWLFGVATASAHAHLIAADPAPDGVIARVPAVASFTFDEALNPTLTRVRVLDAAGHAVTAARGYLAPGHADELWRLPLPHLPAGTYSVLWTSESATDGHVMSSFYTFRVTPAGGADHAAMVMGRAAGAMGADTSGANVLLAIDPGAAVTALCAWIEQMAQALWLGALVVELVMLTPARRGGVSPEARLARAATARLWWLVRLAPPVVAAGLAAEVASAALQGTGGDWAQALAPSTLGGVFGSGNGQLMAARLIVLGLATLLAARTRVPSFGAGAAHDEQQWWTRRAAVIAPSRLAAPGWETARVSLAILAALYMLLVAFSGHAASVSPVWLSGEIDWLHLLFTGAWIGGIAAIAFGVMPARFALAHHDRAPAVLPLLNRFSLIAYAAVATLTLSGLYNAVSHLHQPAMVTGTVYGHLLLIKSLLVGALLVMSAAHVHGLRPRIARHRRDAVAADEPARGDRYALVHEGMATLAGRLRLEAVVAAGVLLATALMGQTLPASAAPASNGAGMAPAVRGAADARPTIPAAITATRQLGTLSATLTIAPPTSGAMNITLRLWDHGQALTGDNGAAVVHLYPLAQPSMRAVLTLQAQGTRFTARGSLIAGGTWRADLLVRTAFVNEYRTLPFIFTAGPGAAFLSAHPAASPPTLTVLAAHGNAADTILAAHLPDAAVRLLVGSSMMGGTPVSYRAEPRGSGAWRVRGVDLSMGGRWTLALQVRHGSAWTTVRSLTYSD